MMTRITLPRQAGRVVSSARRERGLTQSQLAQRAGVSRQLVNRLEMGTATGIAFDKLLSIVDAVGCAIDIRPLDDDGPMEEPFVARTQPPDPQLPDLEELYAIDETLFAPRKDGR